MNILLTGSTGLLGSAITTHAKILGLNICSLSRNSIDWTLPAKNFNLLDGHDYIIHAAANTNVEQCETDPDSCYRDNFLLTDLLAYTARQLNIPLVFISSTGVYGTHKDVPYHEFDDAIPTTHHHRSKLLAESTVLRSSIRNIVIRTGWLFGGSEKNPKNFVFARIREAQKNRGGQIVSNAEQRGCPTYVEDVAETVLQLVTHGQFGLFNCVSTGVASRFEYVQTIMNFAGIEIDVCATTSASFKRFAKVSNNEMAVNWHAEQIGIKPLAHWSERLREYIDRFRPIITAELA